MLSKIISINWFSFSFFASSFSKVWKQWFFKNTKSFRFSSKRGNYWFNNHLIFFRKTFFVVVKMVLNYIQYIYSIKVFRWNVKKRQVKIELKISWNKRFWLEKYFEKISKCFNSKLINKKWEAHFPPIFKTNYRTKLFWKS